MFGSDSAPHPKSAKESSGCAAGVFTAPIALEVLVELFEKNGSLSNLQKFVSNNAKEIYGINPPKKSIKLVRKGEKRTITLRRKSCSIYGRRESQMVYRER